MKTAKDFAKEIYMDVCERVEKDGYIAAGFIETYAKEIEEYVQSRIRAASNNGFNRTREIVDLGTVEFNDGMDD